MLLLPIKPQLFQFDHLMIVAPLFVQWVWNTLKITIKGRKKHVLVEARALMMFKSPHGAWEGDLHCLPKCRAGPWQVQTARMVFIHIHIYIYTTLASCLHPSIRCRLRVACRLADDQL